MALPRELPQTLQHRPAGISQKWTASKKKIVWPTSYCGPSNWLRGRPVRHGGGNQAEVVLDPIHPCRGAEYLDHISCTTWRDSSASNGRSIPREPPRRPRSRSARRCWSIRFMRAHDVQVRGQASVDAAITSVRTAGTSRRGPPAAAWRAWMQGAAVADLHRGSGHRSSFVRPASSSPGASQDLSRTPAGASFYYTPDGAARGRSPS